MMGLKLPGLAMRKWPLLRFKRSVVGVAADNNMAPQPESMLSRVMSKVPSVDQFAPMLLPRWRQLRREFDARLPNERRLIILAVIALVGYLCDVLMITPGLSDLKAANQREQVATTARDAMQAEVNRKRVELANRLLSDQKEQEALRKRLSEGEQDLERQKAMLAPAREMQNLLEGLLSQHGQLRLKAMRTQPPVEVSLNAEQRASAAALASPVLYSHGIEISVSGPFLDLVGWLRSVEQLPRRLLWSGMSLSAVDGSAPTLTLQVQTYSPDRDPLEIAP